MYLRPCIIKALYFDKVMRFCYVADRPTDNVQIIAIVPIIEVIICHLPILMHQIIHNGKLRVNIV